MPLAWWVWAYRLRWVWALWAVYAFEGGWLARLSFVVAGGLSAALWGSARVPDERLHPRWVKAQGVLQTVLVREKQHRARCRIRWSWRHVVTATSGLTVKDAHPRIVGWVRIVDGGLAFKVKPVYGQHAETWNNAKAALQTAWRCSEVEFVDRHNRKGELTGLLDATCSLAGILLRPVKWPHGTPDVPSWTVAALPIGVFAGSRPAFLNLDEVSLVVGGPPKAGKSILLHTLCTCLGLMPDQILVIFDLKGIDFAAWRPRCAAYCSEIEQVPEVLAWLVGVMMARKRRLQELDEEKWAGDQITLIVDEFAELPSELFEIVDRLARLGRAMGIRVVLCTQRPAAELGEGFTRIRAMCTSRIGLGPLMAEEARIIIGGANIPKTYVTLPVGCGRLVTEGEHGRSFRVYWAEQGERKVMAAAVASRRPPLVFDVDSSRTRDVEMEAVGTDVGCGNGNEARASGGAVGALTAGSAADSVKRRQLQAVWEALGLGGPGVDGADRGDETARSA